ncbi:MAG: hypothetical protein LLG13_06545 [Bacteroidales bacterium]|nr:hypothetical protein [Bacteroidales bacterium]
MASTTETGHAKNVANFDELTVSVKGYGTDYNPSKTSIKVEALLSLSDSAKIVIGGVNKALPAFSNAVAAREAAFGPLSKLVTRLINALIATDTTDHVDESAKTLARKIQGVRATPKMSKEEKDNISAAGKEVVEISASQMSYDSRLDNFDKLIKLLSSIELYTPNEADLKVDALSGLYNELKTKNDAVVNAAIPLSNARIARNNVLYKDITGMIDVAYDVKAYVKSVFGANSSQYKQIGSLKFTRPR